MSPHLTVSTRFAAGGGCATWPGTPGSRAEESLVHYFQRSGKKPRKEATEVTEVTEEHREKKKVRSEEGRKVSGNWNFFRSYLSSFRLLCDLCVLCGPNRCLSLGADR
jgi:hypothetical protein